mmetsp:Transcript_21967/g.30515  ORF Transcript_21967/g.30515 Transcript_21967/m.30515 type:complete len:102 (+) Transcript_21967:154-459(+)
MNLLRFIICFMAFSILLSVATLSSARHLAGEFVDSPGDPESHPLSNSTEELKAQLSELEHEFDVNTREIKQLRHEHNMVHRDIGVSKMHMKNKLHAHSPTN